MAFVEPDQPEGAPPEGPCNWKEVIERACIAAASACEVMHLLLHATHHEGLAMAAKLFAMCLHAIVVLVYLSRW